MLRQIVLGSLLVGVVGATSGCTRAAQPTATAQRAAHPSVRAESASVLPRDLYPVPVGGRWDYVLRQTHQGSPLAERVMQMGVLRAEASAGGVVEAVLERRYRGLQVPATRVLVRPDGVVLSRLADPVDGPSLTILRGVPAVGSAWPGRPLKPGNDERVVVIGEEDVEVPAGRWRGWRVDHVLRYADGEGDILSYWYVPGIGCARMIERTTIYVGPEKRKLEVEGLLTAQVPGGWPPEPATPPSAGPEVLRDSGLRLLPVVTPAASDGIRLRAAQPAR